MAERTISRAWSRTDGGGPEVVNKNGRGGVVLVCEHASNHIPEVYGNLGLDEKDLNGHIAWDPGAWAVARELSRELDAPLISPGVSRLVYDCNRPLESAGAILDKSEHTDIPGNRGLSEDDRRSRAARHYAPYRAALTGLIDKLLDTNILPTLVSVHSFTPVYMGERRMLDIGILHDDDARLADRLLMLMEEDKKYSVERNVPYGPEDGVTYTLAEHAIPRGLLNVMFEIRNDLVSDQYRQKIIARKLANHIRASLRALGGASGPKVSSL